MKLRFNPSAGVTEYFNGVYFKNEGQPIEVDRFTAESMLRHRSANSKGELVLTFTLADEQDKPATKQEISDTLGTFPEDFPHADVLTKAGYDLDAVRVLDKDALTKIKGIGPQTADAILTALQEK